MNIWKELSSSLRFTLSRTLLPRPRGLGPSVHGFKVEHSRAQDVSFHGLVGLKYFETYVLTKASSNFAIV